ncbi:MAG: hypothetical protein HQ559_04660 [Lentisphaerae bacterium]|nr:hypothetical protein [Lentisphaerota bacterium]
MNSYVLTPETDYEQAGVLGLAGLTGRRIPRLADNVRSCHKPILVLHYEMIVC